MERRGLEVFSGCECWAVDAYLELDVQSFPWVARVDHADVGHIHLAPAVLLLIPHRDTRARDLCRESATRVRWMVCVMVIQAAAVWR